MSKVRPALTRKARVEPERLGAVRKSRLLRLCVGSVAALIHTHSQMRTVHSCKCMS